MPGFFEGIIGGGIAFGTALGWTKRSQTEKEKQQLVHRLEEERVASRTLWLSTIEALTGAMEASDPYHIGHLRCVGRCTASLAKSLGLPQEETDALAVASLLHNIGRLGVPDQILNKADALTPEEQEKLRVHPAIGARILASIPFPHDVLPLVRHHAEHWDGSGYPDGLKGTDIPLGARVLSVANAYSSLLRPRPYREAQSPTKALAEIEARSGTQFDPAVVTAFRTVASQIREELEEGAFASPLNEKASFATPTNARDALYDIAAAQRETHALQKLAGAVSNAVHHEAIAGTVIECVMEAVSPSACALFLPEEENGEYLRAIATKGTNARHLLGSHARIGTYLTGRAYSRSESMNATFHPEDLHLRDVSETWTPFRSTLILPLHGDGKTYGTLNLYSEKPDAFSRDAQRILHEITTQAARALSNAQRYHDISETAYTDALTGLKNGRYLREFIEKEINLASREGVEVAVLNMDLDNFKPINDRFGHARGDQTLREVAEILQQHTRSYDLAARYAGDEFVVVLSHTSRIAAEVVATKLKMAVEKHGEKLTVREPGFPKLGVSIGVALFPQDGADLQTLLCRSDASMYADKQVRKQGRAA